MKKYLLQLILLLPSLICWGIDYTPVQVFVDGVGYKLDTLDHTAWLYEHSISRDRYSGVLVVPDSFVYDGKTYQVTGIGANTFMDCQKTTNVILPSNLQSIGWWAFYDCPSLEKLKIPEGIKKLGTETIRYCDKMKALSLPASLEVIDDNAIIDCDHIEDIYCYSDNTPMVINESTFLRPTDNAPIRTCIDQVTLHVPAGAVEKYKSQSPWNKCKSVVALTEDDSDVFLYDSSPIVRIDNVYYTLDKSESIARTIKIYNSPYVSCGDIVVPGTVSYDDIEYTVSITPYSFSGFSNLTSIDLSKVTTPIGWAAFYDCSSLKSAILPDCQTTVPDLLFAWDRQLLSVQLPKAVKSIGRCAFKLCQNLRFQPFPSSIESLSDSAFYGCRKFEDIALDNIKEMGKFVFSNTGLLHATIPDHWTTIPKGIFAWCESLSEVDIPNHLVAIGDSAFFKTKLVKFHFPDSLKEIGKFAFGWTDIAELYIPDRDIFIKDYAFEYTKITELTIPKTPQIGRHVFEGCWDLVSVRLPENWTSIPAGLFYFCHSLPSIDIPDAVTTIGSMAFSSTAIKDFCFKEGIDSIEGYAFASSKLQTAVLPEGLRGMGYCAFENCNDLRYLVVPKTTKVIGYSAYWNCRKLDAIVCKNPWAETYNYSPTFYHYNSFFYAPEGEYSGEWRKFSNVRTSDLFVDDLSVNKTYHLMNAKTSAFVVYSNESEGLTTLNSHESISTNDINQCWTLIGKDRCYSLYNLGASKYARVNAEGNLELTDEPVFMPMSDAEYGIVFDNNKQSQWFFVRGVDKIFDSIYNTQSTDKHLGIYSLSGIRQSKMSKKGIYIVNGRKVVK